jgi:hypothetical protein
MANTQQLQHCLAFCALLLVTNVTAAPAQVVETVGSRALGMGGAFVGVASDSSATWWNPGGLAAGPYVDVALARATTESKGDLPARRDTVTWFALGTPPFGFSYYRLRLTDITPFVPGDGDPSDPTVTESGSREDRRAGVPVRSLEATQLGATLVQTLIPGIHAGATLKYVRGTLRAGREDSLLPAGTLLDRGDELDGGDADGAFGMDVGVLGVGGPLRAGLLVRNAVESELENAAGVVRLERQFRIGVAYDAEAMGGPPLVVALDVDASRLTTATGDRRNVAIGVEQWLWQRRLGVRGGARFNTVGANERAATGGVSVAVRAGLFLDAHVVGGGNEDDRGWGVAARVSF